MRTVSMMSAALFLSSTAAAADCPTPYTVDQILEDLTVVETAVRESNDAAAGEGGKKMGAGLGCLDEVLPALIAARAYRAVGAGLLAAGEDEDATRWLRTSLEIDPTWEYGINDVPEGHPLRPHFEDLKREAASDPVLLEGKAFAEGEFYLNGRKIAKPQARPDRYHVFQAKTGVLATDVIEGNAFPETALVASEPVASAGTDKAEKSKKPKKEKVAKAPKEKSSKEKVAKAPKEKAPKEASSKPKVRTKTITQADGSTKVITIRKKPPEKYPLLIGGGAIIVGSGALYFAASQKARLLDPSYDGAIRTVLTGPHMAELNAGLDVTGPITICNDSQSPEVDGCFISPANEAERVRKSVNQLVLASASLLAVGVGVTTWGVLVDGDRVMPTVNVRF